MPRAKKATSPRAHTPTDKEIGLRIRAIRTDLGISQDDLGKALNVSFQQIQKYEKGVNRISASRIIQISHALETSPHHLLGWNAPARMEEVQFDLPAYKLAKRYMALPENLLGPMRSFIDVLIRDYEKAGG